jgi:hypothetical protein
MTFKGLLTSVIGGLLSAPIETTRDLPTVSFTVRNQVKVIIRKLELKNRTQVAYLIGRHQNGREAATALAPTPAAIS